MKLMNEPKYTKNGYPIIHQYSYRGYVMLELIHTSAYTLTSGPLTLESAQNYNGNSVWGWFCEGRGY